MSVFPFKEKINACKFKDRCAFKIDKTKNTQFGAMASGHLIQFMNLVKKKVLNWQDLYTVVQIQLRKAVHGT